MEPKIRGQLEVVQVMPNLKQSTEYSAFHNARQRCNNTSNPQYPSYGGRGIKFLFASFSEFLMHIGPKPSPQLTLDRIENNGNYELGNVAWRTPTQQNLNQRLRKDNTLGYRGISPHQRGYRTHINLHGKRIWSKNFKSLDAAFFARAWRMESL